MWNRSFAKYEGAGNDFVLVDDRSLVFPIHPILIQGLCDRKFGVGADGVILLQLDPKADFRMRIFNRDGGEAEGCGNGLRCLARFLLDLGLPPKPYRVVVHNRIVELEYREDLIRVEMGEPKDLALHLKTEAGAVHFVDTGVPHAVLFVEDVTAAPLSELGPFLRHHPLFHPRGANANLASLQPDGSIRVRTFERGVEEETLACGTGACAVAVIAASLFGLSGPVRISYQGGDLEVGFQGSKIFMTGPAKRVFEGKFLL
ncbi:MAG: diaminopimelate epimerase [Verrucomicrobiota bacterium]|nr:diaminopimelate epimerase [Verrucomicrobiota bacterium]